MYTRMRTERRRENSISLQIVEFCLSSSPIESSRFVRMRVDITLARAVRTVQLRALRIWSLCY